VHFQIFSVIYRVDAGRRWSYGHGMKQVLDIEDQAVRLPHRERARIALKLIESLEPGKDEDVSDLWLQEAEQRLADYDAGKAVARDVDVVMDEAAKRLK
jgi:putative addiction module component (TIGR02574 family)